MSNSTTNLDLISSSQSGKEITANALFDAASPSMLYGRRASTTVALTWGYYGGCINGLQIADGTVTLAVSVTNYIEANTLTGVVTVNSTGWTGGTYARLYSVVVGIGTVTSYIDWRMAGALGAAPISSQALIDYGNNSITTAGLTYGYNAGLVRNDNVVSTTAAGAVTLTASTTNYVQVSGTGVVTANTTGFTSSQFPMAIVVTGVSAITSIIDKRTLAEAGILPIGAGGTGTGTATGTGNVVLQTSPTLVSPVLGTPSSGVATNLTGTAAGLTAGTVTTNANLTGPITSIGNATAVGSQTGTGSKFVMDTSPTLVTPVLGVATATSLNKVTVTQPATASTLTIDDGKTLRMSFSGILAGTDGQTHTFPTTSSTLARTDAAQTFTGVQTFNNQIQAADGSNTTPTYSFGSQTGTGFYSVSSGNVGFSCNGTYGINFGTGIIQLTNSFRLGATAAAPDVFITREGANILTLRNGSSAQGYRAYNTFTDASNYEKADFGWSGNVFIIGTTALGTGVSRRLRLTSSTNFVEVSNLIAIANGGSALGAPTNSFKQLYLDYTNTATVGAVTINKTAGRVNIAAGQTSIVVTNSFCTAAAHVFPNVANVDTTAKSAQITPGAGSFTVTLNAAATAQVAVDFFILNAD